MARFALVWILAALASAPAAAQRLESVFGTHVRLEVRGADRAAGELLAVERDSLWLLPAGGPMRAVGLRDVRAAQVPRLGTSAGTILAWTAIGGLVSGLALTMACNSVEGADCGGVFPLVAGAWLVVGGASAAMSGSGWRSLPTDPPSLAPYARFPQGLPAAFVPEARADSSGR